MTDDRRKHIVVVGAGAAGLTAAHRLGHYGHRVTVLECQSRVGGRATTLRSLFAQGLVAQAGPARFPCDLARVQRYASKFDLALVPFYPSSGTFVAFLDGVRIGDHKPSPEEFWGYRPVVDRHPRSILRLATRIAASARDVIGRALGRRLG